MIYLATPQDTLFHIIPHVAKLTGQHSLPLQDIIDALPEPLPSCTPPYLITAICNCTPSSNVIIPDTYKLSPSRLLRILVRKVDALVSVLGTSLVAEFVHKPLALVIGQEPPSNIAQITDLARRKCAMDIISADLLDQFSNLLYESTEYYPLIRKLMQFYNTDYVSCTSRAIASSCYCGSIRNPERRFREASGERRN